jgi:hypothetical protein
MEIDQQQQQQQEGETDSERNLLQKEQHQGVHLLDWNDPIEEEEEGSNNPLVEQPAVKKIDGTVPLDQPLRRSSSDASTQVCSGQLKFVILDTMCI